MLESQNIINSKDLNDLIKLFNEIIQYLSSLFSVIHENVMLDKNLINDECEISKFSPDIENTFYIHDLLIFPIINTDLDENTLAQAWICLSLEENDKPIAGVVEISPDFSLIKVDSDYYMELLQV